MIEKTKCIVLHTLQFKDNMSIVHLYTEQLGRVACFLPISKGKKTMVKSNMFHSLAILELEIDHKMGKDIHRIKESKIAYPLSQIPFHPVKSAIALFIAEFLYRSIREHEQNQPLYRFLENAVQILDLSDKSIANFHLVFLLKLTAYFGFYPNDENIDSNPYFDMLNGVFVSQKPFHGHFLDQQETKELADLLSINFDNMEQYSFNRQSRQKLIASLIEYYRLHLSSLPEIKSLEVLKMLFA